MCALWQFPKPHLSREPFGPCKVVLTESLFFFKVMPICNHCFCVAGIRDGEHNFDCHTEIMESDFSAFLIEISLNIKK